MVFSVRICSSIKFGSCLGLILLISSSTSAFAQSSRSQYASHDRSRAAIGYYSKSRALLVEALAQFDQGLTTANPDLLLDSEEWRQSVVTLTEQLNRVIDPRPRIDNQGVTYTAQQRFISRARNRVPPAKNGAYDGNRYGEEKWLEDKESAARTRAKLKQPVATAAEAESLENSNVVQGMQQVAEETEAEAEARVAAKMIAQQELEAQELAEAQEQSEAPQGADNLFAEQPEPATQGDVGQVQAGDEATRADVVEQVNGNVENSAPAKKVIMAEDERLGLATEPELQQQEPVANSELQEDQAANVVANSGTAEEDDEEVTQAINAAIQERLKSLEAAMDESE